MSQSPNERLSQILASEVMEKDIVTISGQASLQLAIQLMTDSRISGMPVTDAAGHLLGIVSIRDILEHFTENPEAQRPHRSFYDVALNSDQDFDRIDIDFEGEESATVSDVMTAEVYSVPADASLETVSRTMVDHRIHRVLVQDKDGHVGLIATLDVLAAIIG